MSVLRDIRQSYLGPRKVARRLLAAGKREDRALAMVMGACMLMFIFDWPRLAREAHLEGGDLQMMIGASLMAWVFFMPLALYLLGWLTHLVAKLFCGRGDSYGARLALFWALLAAAPLALLNGLTRGFVGPGLEAQAVGFIWLICFLWFWLSGLIEAERP